MQKEKLISIITPTYNCEDKIEETILSVLAQDEKLYEYIIVDGQSADRTMDIVKKYQDKLLWVSEKDSGIYDAMNKGINLATGKYLFFLGAGDLLKKNVLARIMPSLPDSEYNFVYGNVYLKKLGTAFNGPYDKYKMAKSNICHQSIFYEKNIFKLVGGYDLKYKIFADYPLNMKCFGEPRIKKIYIDEIIVEYEEGGFSDCDQTKDRQLNEDYYKLVAEYLGLDIMIDQAKNIERKMLFYKASAYRHLFKSIGGRPIFLWGAGSGGRDVLRFLAEMGHQADGIIDSNIAKQGQFFYGVQIYPPQKILESSAQKLPFVIISSGNYKNEIKKQLLTAGFAEHDDFECYEF